MARIYLSPPHLSGREQALVAEAIASNWIAPLGPHVDAFEGELALAARVGGAVALASGTAALHLALLVAGVGPGDRVAVSTLTFSASANPVVYVGATPVFIDCDATWTMDPELLEEELVDSERAGQPIRAVIAVDLYGQSCAYDRLAPLCARHGSHRRCPRPVGSALPCQAWPHTSAHRRPRCRSRRRTRRGRARGPCTPGRLDRYRRAPETVGCSARRVRAA